MSGEFLLIYICNFHVLSHLLLIYICKLHLESGGLGNLLIFFPSVYYFAALSGREIVIVDKSLLGEICRVVICGYPLLSTMSESYPTIFSEEALAGVVGLKVFEFAKYLTDGPQNWLGASFIRADGYKYASDWWLGDSQRETCLQRLTGCEASADVACMKFPCLKSFTIDLHV